MGSEAVLFRRYEKKFLLGEEIFDRLLERLRPYLVDDKYAYSTITNVYYDTPSFFLIRQSLEGPVYKEKLRLRSYGVPSAASPVFVEIKKKYDGVVYKRRLSMNLSQAEGYLSGVSPPPRLCQEQREIDFFLRRYEGIGPAMYISYDRYSLADPEGGPVRITFDRNITWRRDELALEKGVYGEKLLAPEQILMEVKVPEVYPLWLVKIFEELGIRATSFSKYGRIFQRCMEKGLLSFSGA